MTYHPHPSNNSAISLPPEMEELCEVLARNVHENWAAQRVADGWRYGAVRHDGLKEHPSLVPFDSLGEDEKEYDRRAVRETIKSLLALGYRIEHVRE